MTAKRDEKRKILRTKLIDAAHNRIKINGLPELRARDVTSDAGCALGGLYTAFDDLDDLILHVNARTLHRLNTALEKATAGRDPSGALHALALGYAAFARSNRTLWDALFEHRLDRDTPDWFQSEQISLLQNIVGPLARLQPALTESELHLRARTYFSAVHGIVSMSLQGRFVGIPGKALRAELDRFVEFIIIGSAAQAD